MVHECRCGCIQLGTPVEIVRLPHVTAKPIEITDKETFSVEIKVPPLYRPDVELLVETINVKDEAGAVVETSHFAYLGEKEVKIGSVVVVLNDLSTTDGDKDTAVQKLCDLVGKAVVQAWADLAGSDDPNKQAAARAMEIK